MKEVKVKEASSAECSSKDYATEDYNWIDDDNFSEQHKLEYLNYPLNEWKDIVYKRDLLNEETINSFGEFYQGIVNKVLKYNIFKGFNFFKETEGKISFNLKSYNTNIDISPDFFVHKMTKNEYNKLLGEKKYMMTTNYKIPENIKYVSIIGEIKMARKEALKQTKQKERYDEFSEKASNDEEKLIVMYIFDESFSKFKEDFEIIEKNPRIYCHIPKLYQTKCYDAYNKIVEKYKQNKAKINLNTDGKYINQKDVLKMFEDLNYKFNIAIYYIIGTSILFISYILYNIIPKLLDYNKYN